MSNSEISADQLKLMNRFMNERFNAIVKKYTKKLFEARGGFDDIDSEEADVLLSIGGDHDDILAGLISRHPALTNGLVLWFIVCLWLAATSVEPVSDMNIRETVIVSIISGLSASLDELNVTMSQLDENIIILKEAQNFGDLIHYQALFNSCMVSYCDNKDTETGIAASILQIGGELTEIQLDATNDLIQAWNFISR